MPEPTITIVSGVPRSGTSLMMQMLEAAGVEPLADRHRPADESNPKGYYELEAVKRSKVDTRWVEDAEGRAVKVIHALLGELPRDRHYRVIFMQRDLDEVIDSQDRMLERLGEAPPPLPRERVRAVFEKQVAEALRLLEGEPCFDAIVIEHAQLIAQPIESARRIAAFIGRSDVAGAMAACVAPDLHRERRV